MKQVAPRARHLFLLLAACCGAVALAVYVPAWDSPDPLAGLVFILVAVALSALKISLPRIDGTLSVTFVFVLVGLMKLSLAETLLMGSAAKMAQLLARYGRKGMPYRAAIYHVGHLSVAIVLAHRVLYSEMVPPGGLRIALAATMLYGLTTFLAAAQLSSGRKEPLARLWRECSFWTLPYFLAGAAVAALVHVADLLFGAQSPVLVLPVAFLIYCGFNVHVRRFTAKKAHLEAMSALHVRTIEALALAIESKEHAAQDHLRRMQLYCIEIGREMGMEDSDIEALRTAALLHDVGKLAVPDHILRKPGKLTQEEYEKVKIHPVVGAEILERVEFPFPVARLVRAHHEKWNGTGYPDRLKGDAIPLGARILAAVDCLDALISERPYRHALSLEEALARIQAESGVSFDPKVIQVLRSRYAELEARLSAERADAAPAPRKRTGATTGIAPCFSEKIAEARNEAQVLHDLSQALGTSLLLDETLPSLGKGLGRIVPYNSLAVYVLRDGKLVPRYTTGEQASRLRMQLVPLGEGLVGRAAQQNKPMLNADPVVEFGSIHPAPGRETPRCALAVPLPGGDAAVGAILVCRRGGSCYDRDHLRILLGLSAKLGVVVENSLMYEQATVSAASDFLTGLPNLRSLQKRLETELARAERTGESLAVLVADLDGFKQVNDRFGHIEGNAVLQVVSATIKRSCREYDYLARMGGDEFALLLPGLTPSDIEQKVAQLNVVIGEAAEAVCPGSVLGLSVGYARFPEDGSDVQRLLSVADQRMYETKQLRKLRSCGSRAWGYDFDRVEEPTAR